MYSAFGEFRSGIDRLLAGHPKSDRIDVETHERFLDLCRASFGRVSLEEFVGDYVDDLNKNDHNSGSSLFHENGFVKLSMWKFPCGAQLRYHIWPAGSYIDSRIHSHRWNLSSYILRGELTAFNYSEDDENGSLFSMTKLFDADGDGIKPSEFIGKKRLARTASYSIRTNDGHYVDQKILHQVKKSSGDIAISLMLSGRALSPYSVVSDFVPGYKSVARRFLSPSEISRLVTDSVARTESEQPILVAR